MSIPVLNWNLTRDTDRTKCAAAALETLMNTPTPPHELSAGGTYSVSPIVPNATLESYANYILWGEDDSGATQSDKGLTPRAHKGTPISLEGLAESDSPDSPASSYADLVVMAQERDPAVLHPSYHWKRDPSHGTQPPAPSTPTDSTPSNWWWDYRTQTYKPMPDMELLWDSIDRLKSLLDTGGGASLCAATKMRAPDGTPTEITPSHRTFILKRSLREQRFTQCLLRDSYAPTLAPHPTWNSFHPDSIAADRIDLEDPKHIKCLLRYYCALREDTYERLENSMHMLLVDLECLIDSTPLSHKEIFCACGLMMHKSLRDLADDWTWQTGTPTTETEMALWTNNMCRKLALKATENRLIANAAKGLLPSQTCVCCGRTLPQTTFFFYKNNHCKRGYNIRCKECCRQRQATQRKKLETKPAIEQS